MFSNYQYLSIFLYQKAFWYLPPSLIDLDFETCSLRINKQPKWRSLFSLASALVLSWIFLFASIVATVQSYSSEKLLENKNIVSFSAMWLLNCFAIFSCGCLVIMSMDIDCVEGLNQLILLNYQLQKHRIHGMHNLVVLNSRLIENHCISKLIS